MWAEFLRRVRDNKNTAEDYNYIDNIARTHENLESELWRDAVTLTSQNGPRELISNRCAKRNAHHENVRLLRWTAVYHSKNNNDHNRVAESWKTATGPNCGPHEFSFVPNMPVMFLSNQVCGANSVSYGIANGSMGSLLGLVVSGEDEVNLADPRNEQDYTLRHVPHGAFVYVKNLRIEPLPNLPQHIIHLAEGHSESIVYVKAVKGKLEDVAATRTQIPLMPAYALTIHKAQGLSLDKCIIDTVTKLVGVRHNSIYVALSRVKSTQGLAFIGKNPSNWIKQIEIPNGLLDEEARLRTFSLPVVRR